jgi:hypothetical protein
VDNATHKKFLFPVTHLMRTVAREEVTSMAKKKARKIKKVKKTLKRRKSSRRRK